MKLILCLLLLSGFLWLGYYTYPDETVYSSEERAAMTRLVDAIHHPHGHRMTQQEQDRAIRYLYEN